LWANVRYTNFLDRHGNFKDFVTSIITLFRMSTGKYSNLNRALNLDQPLAWNSC
jgi:hypothetical protein